MTDLRCATRSEPDEILKQIAEYVVKPAALSPLAYDTARLCLMDSVACLFAASQFDACRQRLGPIVPGMQCENGVRVPSTNYELDPVQAAFNIGTLIRWLDFNDTWLAAEWGHPSDNLGGILAIADYLSRQRVAQDEAPLSVHDVLTAMIKAYEIQGVLALENSFNQVGLDHVILVRVATTAVVTQMLGGDQAQVMNALSNAWLDGGALRTYRHAPNTGVRKSWAAGDATSRGVRHALMAMAGEMGYPTALSAPTWGFYARLFEGKSFVMSQPLDAYVMENILFKVAFPAEFHAQTAVEAGLQLHADVVNRLDEIERIVIETQEAGHQIIDKTGQLHNPADRDHCLQYMVAIALIFGRLVAEDYEDDVAADPRIDAIRDLMVVEENGGFTQAYFDPQKRAIPNAVQVMFRDGSATQRIEVNYPLGHRQRRGEGVPLLYEKFERYVRPVLGKGASIELGDLFKDYDSLVTVSVNDLMSKLVV